MPPGFGLNMESLMEPYEDMHNSWSLHIWELPSKYKREKVTSVQSQIGNWQIWWFL